MRTFLACHIPDRWSRDANGFGQISLQNRRISGASAIHESAHEARERARSAKPESSACSHTIKEFKITTTATATGTSLNKRFNE